MEKMSLSLRLGDATQLPSGETENKVEEIEAADLGGFGFPGPPLRRKTQHQNESN